MRGSKLGLLAAAAVVAGVAGCSLPEVLPLAGGTSSGPSPYGVWYEQHWATNAVLLAAADQPEGDETTAAEEAALDAALAEEANKDETAAYPGEYEAEMTPIQGPAPVEASTGNRRAVDFDNSTPYQFPASSYAPAPAPAAVDLPSDDAPAAKPAPKAAPSSGGPIRY